MEKCGVLSWCFSWQSMCAHQQRGGVCIIGESVVNVEAFVLGEGVGGEAVCGGQMDLEGSWQAFI